jgi:AraC-like DNA-binding protein
VPRYQTRAIAAAPELSVIRWCCDGHDAPRPVEEAARTDLLMLPVRGRFVVRTRALGHAVLDPSRGLLLRAGERYDVRHPGGGDDCIAITGAAVERLDREGRAALLAVDLEAQLALLALAPGAPPLAAEAALAAVTAPGAADVAPAAGPADRTIAARIAAFVAEHYDQPLRLADLADAARVSPHHACRAFRRATGRTIHAHHEDVRLRHALGLVLDTDRPLAEIATTTGFANQGHLGNRFRRRFGTSPGRARRTGRLR